MCMGFLEAVELSFGSNRRAGHIVSMFALSVAYKLVVSVGGLVHSCV